MGGVALLHPQDVLKNHFVKQPLISSSPPLYMKQQPRSTTTNNHNRRKKSNSSSSASSPVPNKAIVNKISPAPVMGQVRILKRGQDLDLPATARTTSDRVTDVVKVVETGEMDRIGVNLEVRDRWGPEPEILSKQKNVLSGFYAGSAIISSPPPSSLPLPGFFSKNINNKHATNDLLRMLRLDLA